MAPSAAATRPAATLPASTYEARPPYPVQLHVRSPRDPQPGWLKIIELQDLHQPATAAGKFPRQNRIYVDTVNVQKIRIHIGHLPIGEGKPIMLQIDEQVMEIRGKRNREFITMGRTQVGVWESVPD